MTLVENLNGHYNDALERHCDYSRFSKPDHNTIFFHGMGCTTDGNYDHLKKINRDINKIYFNYEQPCAWFGDFEYAKISADTNKVFNKIYTACPYSAKWINDMENSNRFELAIHPFNELKIENHKEKEFDIIYWGGVHHDIHKKIISTISSPEYKYNFLSLGSDHWGLRDQGYDRLITGLNIPREKMWSLIRKTKINIIVNLLFINSQHIQNIKKINNWEENIAFDHINSGIIPQQKTRAVESAVNKCLMLVRRDPWNVIEYWFEPDVDFVYYDNEKSLPRKINEILSDWDSYEKIINNAFNKAKNNYTTEKFISRINLP